MMLGFLAALLPFLQAPIGKLLDAGADKLLGIRPGDPRDVGERIQLMNAETSKLTALYGMDGGETYKWVEAIRKLQRPAVVGAVTYAFVMTNVFDHGSVATAAVVADLTSAVFGYLFGERTKMYLRGNK